MDARPRILVVDAESAARNSTRQWLTDAGYGSEGAASLRDARETLAGGGFDLVMCDPQLPGEDAMALMEELEAAPHETGVLIATAIDSPEIAHTALALGANGYLVKPFTRNELMINLDYALRDSERRMRSAASDQLEEQRVAEVRAAMERLETATAAVDRQAAQLLRPLSEAVGRRDLETAAHIRRVGESSALLAEAGGLDADEVESLRLAAPMHDVGKVAIPDSVLLKEGPLDPAERQLVHRHAEIGHHILAGSDSPLLELAAEVALTHHEKIDGSGYPKGLKGDEIPVSGRIVAITDVYDALTSDRPYRPALSVDAAIGIMTDGRGTHFDPRLFDLFLARFDSVRQLGEDFAED